MFCCRTRRATASGVSSTASRHASLCGNPVSPRHGLRLWVRTARSVPCFSSARHTADATGVTVRVRHTSRQRAGCGQRLAPRALRAPTRHPCRPPCFRRDALAVRVNPPRRGPLKGRVRLLADRTRAGSSRRSSDRVSRLTGLPLQRAKHHWVPGPRRRVSVPPTATRLACPAARHAHARRRGRRRVDARPAASPLCPSGSTRDT